jgi:hypothetical protein
MNLTLLASLVCLALWATFTFVRPIGLGIVHILLGIGAVMWIRWWALREEKRPQ